MIVLLLSVLLVPAPPQAAQNNAASMATVEGRVLRVGSSDPIPNVQVTLVKPGSGTTFTAETAAALDSLQTLIATAPPGVSQATLDTVITSRERALGLAPGTFASTTQTTALTDASGHFSFKNQAPGKYTIRAVLDGYFGTPVNGSASTMVTKTITVEAQKPVPAVDLFMIKGGIISGRIRDPNGQPASGVSIGASRVTYFNGRPFWTVASSKVTDDRGEYRIFWLGPGEYYIGITPRPVAAIPGPQDTWVRTSFPGVSDPTTATALTIQDGAELAGMDFTIQTLAATGTFKIKGTASNPFATPNAATGVVDRTVSSFYLAPREPGFFDSILPPLVQNALSAAARPNGEFEIRNVPPGSYDLIAFYGAPNSPQARGGVVNNNPGPVRRYYMDRARIEVRNSDIEGITLTIQKGTEVQGKVVNQGSKPIPLDKVKIFLRSQDSTPEIFATIVGAISVDASGDFVANDIAAARYTVLAYVLPDTAYVADIRQAGTSIFDTGMTVGEQSTTSIEILVNSNGATVDGNVQTPQHKPASTATVVLVPPASHRQNSMMYKTAQTDETGSFSMKGIPPGEYTLFAWESVLPSAWMNSEFLAKYQNRGRQVIATQGSRQDVQLELIPDDSNRRQETGR